MGHGPDVTIADFVADLRAATPPTPRSWRCPIRTSAMAGWIRWKAAWSRGHGPPAGARPAGKLEQACEARALRDPMNLYQDRRILLDYQQDRLADGLGGALGGERSSFARLAAALDALSPLKVLGRGYAIPQRSRRGGGLAPRRSP